MNLSNSDLFKTFARPVLRQNNTNDNMNQEEVASTGLGVMDRIIQMLINRSSLEVTRVSISHATEDSYVISIESRVTGTGPISSTVSSMDLDLTFNGFPFGSLTLPEIKTSLWGTDVVVDDQKVKVTDMAIFKAFVRSIIVNDETNFELENGLCAIKALGISANCNYCLRIPIQAMAGPKTTLTNLVRDGDGITATFRIRNPSPVEIDQGNCTFELRNQRGETMVELKGYLKIVQGDFNYVVRGVPRQGVVPTDKARLVGVGVEGKSWCNDTIHYLDLVVDVKPEFADLLRK